MTTIIKATSKNKRVRCEIARNIGFEYTFRIIDPRNEDVSDVGEINTNSLAEAFNFFKIFCRNNRVEKSA